MRWFQYLLLLLLLLLAASFPLAKQPARIQTGCIQGFVMDESGAPIPEASIEARNVIRGDFAGARSQPNGFYALTGLTPGRYAVWAAAKGHSFQWVPQVVVEEGQPTRQDFRLMREGPSDDFLPTVLPAH